MPVYQFRCATCDEEFDVKRGFSESSDEASCPADGGVGVRVFSAPMVFTSTRGGTTPLHPPTQPPPSPPGGGHGHGHSHGPGTHSH